MDIVIKDGNRTVNWQFSERKSLDYVLAKRRNSKMVSAYIVGAAAMLIFEFIVVVLIILIGTIRGGK